MIREVLEGMVGGMVTLTLATGSQLAGTIRRVTDDGVLLAGVREVTALRLDQVVAVTWDEDVEMMEPELEALVAVDGQ